MKLDVTAEGFVDYLTEREEQDARELLLECSLDVLKLDALDEDDFVALVRAEHRAAHRRAIAAGVFDDQPGEASWLTLHRLERD